MYLRLKLMRWWVVLAAAYFLSGDLAQAQVRFPGDSPRRFVPRSSPSFQSSRAFSTFSSHRFGRTYRGFSGYGVGPFYGSRYSGPVYAGPRYDYYGYNYGGYGYPSRYHASDYCEVCGGYGWGCRCRRPIYYPPVVVDPNTLYGPQALLRFYGIGNRSNHSQQPQASQKLLPAAPRVAARPANAGTRARAWRFIDYGDRHLKAGRYREALTRYHKATRTFAELDAAHFRAGFAYLALDNFHRAAQAMQRGLQLNPDWPESQFVVEDLFDDAAQRAVLNALAAHLQELPNDANARLLAGVMLHFDGEPDRAAKQFSRVMELAGEDSVARLFLPKPPAEDQPLLPPAE